MINKKVTFKIRKAPSKPGVYYFYKNKKVIYVGKAIKLKERLRTYLDKTVLSQYTKTAELMENADDVAYTLCSNEIEALVIESNLIKRYQPKYNINLKDDKYFKYIKIEKQKDKSYKISTVRKKDLNSTKYFGPYTEGATISSLLRNIRKLLPFRDCNTSKYNYYKDKKSPCLYGHIGLCAAPCQGAKQTIQNNNNVRKIKLFLKGRYKKVLKDLEKEMKQCAQNNDFEKAINLRNRLENYKKMSQYYLNEVELLSKIGSLEDERQNVVELFNILSGYFTSLKNTGGDLLIEFYDVSNLGDKFIVGASISILNGKFYKQNYRKYKIKSINRQNDFYAMKEMILRRLNNINIWGAPNLIVLDGGKGQLSVCSKLLDESGIPYIALAKKQEEIYLKHRGQFFKISLSRFNKALQVLIRGRNEVHRFVLGFNRKSRVY